jgi:hypothetical protein
MWRIDVACSRLHRTLWFGPSREIAINEKTADQQQNGAKRDEDPRDNVILLSTIAVPTRTVSRKEIHA